LAISIDPEVKRGRDPDHLKALFLVTSCRPRRRPFPAVALLSFQDDRLPLQPESAVEAADFSRTQITHMPPTLGTTSAPIKFLYIEVGDRPPLVCLRGTLEISAYGHRYWDSHRSTAVYLS
jgi:hypothetical protein